jgi:hypothetical protein
VTLVSDVDDAIDQLMLVDPNTVRFTAAELAVVGNTTVPWMSQALQVHRQAQQRGITRYVAQCRTYGPDAIWAITAGPNTPRVRRIALASAQHIANDLQMRAESDLRNELDPAALAHPVIQALLAGFGATISAATNGLVNSINVALQVHAISTGEQAELIP